MALPSRYQRVSPTDPYVNIEAQRKVNIVNAERKVEYEKQVAIQ